MLKWLTTTERQKQIARKMNLMFGSRAKGNARPNSDIDLALCGSTISSVWG